VIRIRKRSRKRKYNTNQEQQSSKVQNLTEDFNQNIEAFRSIYANCSDVAFRSFLISGTIKATLIYIEGLVNTEEIDQHVLSPLMRETDNGPTTVLQMVEQKLAVSKVKEVMTFADCVEALSIGNPVLLWESGPQGLALGLTKWEKRAIAEPTGEGGVRVPREGFTETVSISTSQLRRIIKSPALKMESMKIGKYTETNVVLAYIEGIAEDTLIKEVKNRLSRIQIDGILESGYIEEMIEDNPLSPFPQILTTERPDVACGSLLEGRVVILVDGTPFVLIAPITLFSLLQTGEDYYERFFVSTVIRWLRYVFFVVSLLLPSLYVSVLTYHHEMIPTSLLISMASSREAVPFPAVIEALLMEIAFEALREAGVRLPKQIGSAVSIVGALVIGQAAVSAGLVSTPMVMVVAMTGIASFMVPRYIVGITIRMLRFPIMLLAGTLGLLGVILGMIAIALHLCTLRSFGVPYLTPLAPMKMDELKDTLVRAPHWMMDTRPHFTGDHNKYRQSPGMKPDPTKGGDT
jgi:spore germination protein KA